MIRAALAWLLVAIADLLVRGGLALIRAANRIDGPPSRELFAESVGLAEHHEQPPKDFESDTSGVSLSWRQK